MSVCESVHTTTTTAAKLWLHNAHRHPDVLHTLAWTCKVVPLQPNESKLQLDVYLCLLFPLSNLSHSCILVIIKILRCCCCCSDGENRAASFFFLPTFPQLWSPSSSVFHCHQFCRNLGANRSSTGWPGRPDSDEAMCLLYHYGQHYFIAAEEGNSTGDKLIHMN